MNKNLLALAVASTLLSVPSYADAELKTQDQRNFNAVELRVNSSELDSVRLGISFELNGSRIIDNNKYMFGSVYSLDANESKINPGVATSSKGEISFITGGLGYRLNAINENNKESRDATMFAELGLSHGVYDLSSYDKNDMGIKLSAGVIANLNDYLDFKIKFSFAEYSELGTSTSFDTKFGYHLTDDITVGLGIRFYSMDPPKFFLSDSKEDTLTGSEIGGTVKFHF